ncbi:MAG: BatD family protein [Candidatus Omnitrophota bacterium]
MFSRLAIVFLLLFCFVVNARPQDKREDAPISVQAQVDKKDIHIGDRVRYTIEARAKKGLLVRFPSFADSFPGLAVRDFGSQKRSKLFSAEDIYRKWYILDTYATGEYVIPSFSIKYKYKEDKDWREIDTSSLALQVRSLLGGGGRQGEAKGIKGPLSYASRGLWIFLLIVAIVILLGLAAAIAAKRRRRIPRQPCLPAEEIARRQLERLRQEGLVERGRIKEYYLRVSLIIRHYLENKFSLRAPEMTTEEFLYSLRESHSLSYEHKGLLRDFLGHCDMVKFARYQPSPEEINLTLQSAQRLIKDRAEIRSAMIAK